VRVKNKLLRKLRKYYIYKEEPTYIVYKSALINIGYEGSKAETIANNFHEVRNELSLESRMFLDDLFNACLN
jgi:hypothetical protein